MTYRIDNPNNRCCKRTVVTEVREQFVPFGIFDNKGREVGIYTATYEVEYTDQGEGARSGYSTIPGRYFAVRVQTTRGGETYGASQPEQRFTTKEERAVYMAKRMAAGLKAAEKKFG